MPLNIKNVEVERLVEEVVARTGETKTGAVRQALADRLDRLRLREAEGSRRDRLRRFLEREVWARVPAKQMGKPPDAGECDRILGYGAEGP